MRIIRDTTRRRATNKWKESVNEWFTLSATDHPCRRTIRAANRLTDMNLIMPLFGLVLLSALPAAAQTPAVAPPAAPPSNTTTIVLPDNAGPATSTTSTTSQTGSADTTVTSVKRENGSTTTVITQQPQSTYQPMGRGGYQPMGR
jgi:hypothetical protein